MSVKKWRQQTEEKGELYEQEEQSLPKIQNEQNKQRVWPAFGRRAFKPITKRLDKATKEPEQAEEPVEEHDYGIDEFDSVNPFNAVFRSDDETPTPTASFPGPPIHQHRHYRHQYHHHQYHQHYIGRRRLGSR